MTRINTNVFDTFKEVRKVAVDATCHCGSGLKYGERDGKWVATCLRDPGHRSLRVKA